MGDAEALAEELDRRDVLGVLGDVVRSGSGLPVVCPSSGKPVQIVAIMGEETRYTCCAGSFPEHEAV
jgi:hypothetical protein